MQIATSDATSATEALAGTTALPEKVDALIEWRTANGECYSSGEIAALIREDDPNFVFSVLTVGNILRDAFYAGTLPCYDDGAGQPVQPFQVPRTTVGLFRTPPDQQVFVYAFCDEDGFDHDFEVYVPEPGQDLNVLPAPPANANVNPEPGPALQAAPAGTVPAVSTGSALLQNPITAKVHSDKRLCLTRGALDALCHTTGQSLRGGDPVYVEVTDDEVKVALAAFPGSKSYDISASRGRALFPSAGTPFTPGDTFEVTVTAAGLVIDLS